METPFDKRLYFELTFSFPFLLSRPFVVDPCDMNYIL